MSTTNPNRVSPADQIGIWIFIVAAVIFVGISAWLSGMRIADILGPGPYDVEVELIHSTASVSYGDAGATIPVAIGSGRIQVGTIPAPSLLPGVLSPVVTTLTIAGITVFLTLLAASILRGRIFSKRNSRLVISAGLFAMLGFPLASLLETMHANGAVAVATGGQLDNFAVTVSPAQFTLIAFATGVIGTAFTIGERLQRETEGLV